MLRIAIVVILALVLIWFAGLTAVVVGVGTSLLCYTIHELILFEEDTNTVTGSSEMDAPNVTPKAASETPKELMSYMRPCRNTDQQYLYLMPADFTKHRDAAVTWLRENFPVKKLSICPKTLPKMMENIRNYVPIFQSNFFKIPNLNFGAFKREGISMDYFGDEKAGRPCLLLNERKYYESMNLLPEYFMDLERMRVRRQDARLSPLDDYRTNTAQLADSCMQKYGHLDAFTLRETVYENTREATEFKPSVLAALLFKFGLNEKSRVLDFCAGRGSRLAACISKGVGYVGVDPDKSLHPVYKEMIDTLAKEPKKYQMVCAKAQELTLEAGEEFDMVMTSPPYGTLEHYSDDSSQSDVEFPTRDSWLNGFLIPSIARATQYLRSGGHVIININDPGRSVQGRWEYVLLMLVKIRDSKDPELRKLKYLGMIGYAEPGKPAQPMWVWTKGK